MAAFLVDDIFKYIFSSLKTFEISMKFVFKDVIQYIIRIGSGNVDLAVWRHMASLLHRKKIHYLLAAVDVDKWKFVVKHTNTFIIHCQYYGYCWPNEARRLGISSHGIELFLSEFQPRHQGPISIPDKTFYRKISRNLEAARLLVKIITSLWNLPGTSEELLPIFLSNFRTMGQFWLQISRLRGCTRS